MGDRVSISFKNGDEESVSLFHHWGGVEFPGMALKWAKDFKKSYGGHSGTPITRMEPRTIMVQFIVALHNSKEFQAHDFKGGELVHINELLTYSLYFGVDSSDGDNSDNGHFTIDLDTLEMKHQEFDFEKWKLKA